MPTITSTELGASGRYIDLGATADGVTAQSSLVYFRQSAGGGGGFGYLFGRTPSGSVNGNRLFIRNNGTAGFGSTSTSDGDAPFKAASAWVVDNTWSHIASSWDGGLASSGIKQYSSTSSADLVEDTVDADSVEGIGSLGSVDSFNLILMNRLGLGRHFIGDIAYIARWNRVLSLSEFVDAQQNGPLSVPSGLILCWANKQDLSPNAYAPVARSAYVAGALPPNTALGGDNGIAGNAVSVATATGALTSGSAVLAGSASAVSASSAALSTTPAGLAGSAVVLSTAAGTLTGVAAVLAGDTAALSASTGALTVQTKGATITLYDAAAAQASVTSIRALWWDSAEPAGAPVYSTTSASTDGSGVLTLDLDASTALAIDDPGFLLLYKLDGTDHRDSLQFAGQVLVSDIA